MNVRKQLDNLIDWYDRYPERDVRVISVDAAANTIKKFARKKRRGPYTYREREIIPIRLPRKSQPAMPLQTVIE